MLVYSTLYKEISIGAVLILVNVLTIGQVSKLYACQKGRVKIQVCKDFGTVRVNELERMLSIMTKFRMYVHIMTVCLTSGHKMHYWICQFIKGCRFQEKQGGIAWEKRICLHRSLF